MATTSSGRPPPRRASRARRAGCARRRASDLSPSQTAALATIERHGPLTPERARRPRAHPAPHGRRACSRASRRPGWSTARADPADRRSSLVDHHPRRRARCSSACARRKDAFLARRLTALERRGPRDAGPRRRTSSSGCSRTMTASAALAAPSLPRGPQLPPLLRRPGRLDLRQLDADRRRDVAGRAAHRQRRRRRPRPPALQFLPMLLFGALGRRARRPHAPSAGC